MKCEGVAELSEVPNLLSDESIAAVVLAATAAPEGAAVEGADKGGGIDVPEMSITGRRLNREVGFRMYGIFTLSFTFMPFNAKSARPQQRYGNLGCSIVMRIAFGYLSTSSVVQ